MKSIATILADFRFDFNDMCRAWEKGELSDKKALKMLVNLCIHLLRDALEHFGEGE